MAERVESKAGAREEGGEGKNEMASVEADATLVHGHKARASDGQPPQRQGPSR